jgi:hypothetical protein
MATEQAGRMLKTYRTKVTLCADRGVDWGEVENELQKTLNAVREKKVALRYTAIASERSTSGDATQMTNESETSLAAGTAVSETSDVESLRLLLQRTSVADDELAPSGDGVQVAMGSG